MTTAVKATLNGLLVTSARVAIPAWGIWYAEVSIDGEHALTGKVALVIADLTLTGTILSGGPATGRSHFRLAGGAGGWGKTLPKRNYDTDADVKLSTVLNDAAHEAGETIDLTTVTNAQRVGPCYGRRAGLAQRVLELHAPGAWYVGEDGVTRLGKRASHPLGAKVTHGPVDRARGNVTLASDLIATILPGVVVDGFEAVDIEHTISAEGGLRSIAWGARGTGSNRRLAAQRKIFEALFPELPFLGTWEYRVVSQDGKRLNLQAVRASTGMPDLRRVKVRPGLAGADSMLLPGTRVLVTFVDAQPGRPEVIAFEDADGAAFVPLLTHIDATTFLKLCDGLRPMGATGDLAGPFSLVGTTRVLG